MASQDYLDFEIEIGPGIGGREYPVAVIRSPGGEARERLTFPFDELALRSHLKDLQIALLRSGGVRRTALTREEQTVREFGEKLFTALINGEVRSRYDISQQAAIRQGKGLRVKLRIRPPELASLPWEFLYDPRASEYICLSMQTPLVRYVELPHEIQPLTVLPPLRILGVTASPHGLAPLDIDNEKLRVETALAGLIERKQVEIVWQDHATWRDLQRLMRSSQGPWHILHFIGHGGFDRVSDEGFIALESETGELQRLPATQLGRLIADHTTLRLAILNSCEGAEGSDTDIFSSTASLLIRRGLPAVLAMQYEISDRAAVEFARGFYEAIADGLPVDAATAEARKSVSMGVNNTIEWGTPILFMRAPDGVLFKQITPAEARRLAAERRAREKNEREVRERIQHEAAERVAHEQAEREAAIQAAREKALQEAAQKAFQEELERIEREKAIREKAVEEKAEQEAIEKAAREKAEKEATEKATREAAEKALREKAEREAVEKYTREKAKREKADRQLARKAAIKRTFSQVVTSLKFTIRKSPPVLRIIGILGIFFLLFWGISRVAPQLVEIFPTPTRGATPIGNTPSPTALPTEVTDSFGVEMIRIPKGEFVMGSNSYKDDEKPAHKVALEEFLIDKYEVTNALYAKCVESGTCTAPKYSGSNTRSIYYGNSKYDDYPVVYVNWFMAKTFCEWRGARLPTEAEWEKAARGTEERTYPWGEGIDMTHVNYLRLRGDTVSVGEYRLGKSPYGVYDMAGNVWEWVSSQYAPYPYDFADGRENTNSPDYRVKRGGSWESGTLDLRTTNRQSTYPASNDGSTGFRCAKEASP